MTPQEEAIEIFAGAVNSLSSGDDLALILRRCQLCLGSSYLSTGCMSVLMTNSPSTKYVASATVTASSLVTGE